MKNSTRIFIFLTLIFISQFSAAQKDTSDMQLDIGWTRDKNINLWPILKYKQDTTVGYLRTDIFFSIYRFGRNGENNEKYSHFYPLWRKKNNLSESDFRLFSMYYPSVFRYHNDKILGLKSFVFLQFAPEISAICFSKSADDLYIENNLLFLLWYKKNEAKKSSFLILFPVYWAFENPQQTTHTLFPVFSYGKYNAGESKYTAVTPLFWHFKKLNETKNILFPIFWNNKQFFKNDTIKKNTLFPVLWTYNRHNEKNFTLLPIVFSQKNQYRKLFIIFPLGGHSESADAKQSATVITPFYWHVKENKKYSDILFPFFWRFRNTDSINAFRRTLLFPIWFSYTARYKKNRVFFPLLWSYRNPNYRSFTIIPFYSQGKNADKTKSFRMISPLYWNIKHYDEKINIFLPVFYSYADSSSHRFTIFPIIWRNLDKYSHSFTIFPVFATKHKTNGSKNLTMITPFFWHTKHYNEKRDILFPLFWSRRYRDSLYFENQTVFFPFWWSYRNNNEQKRVFFPFVWNLKNNYYHSLTVLPLFSYGSDSTKVRRHVAITPLYWNFRKTYQTTNIFFPLFWDINDFSPENPSHRTLLLPFFFRYKDSYKDNLTFFPFFWRLHNPTYQSTTLLPVFSYGISSDSSRKHFSVGGIYWHFRRDMNSRHIIFPIWWYHKYLLEDGEQFSNVVFPVFWSYSDSRHNNNIFFPIAWSLKNETYQSFTFIPLFSFGHSTDYERKHIAVSPLFWFLRNDNQFKAILFPLLWIKNRDGKDAFKRSVVFPVWWSFRDSSSTNQVFFPFAWSIKNPSYQSTTIFPLFSFGKSAIGLRKHFAVTPLFWKFSENDEKNTVIFPFAWFRNRTGENPFRRSVVFPVWWAMHDSTHRRQTLFPVYWLRKDPEFSSFTIFPLFSTSKSANDSYQRTVITPLFWRIKRNDETTQVLLPFYFTKKREKAGSAFKRHTFFPVWWSYRDEKRKNRIVFPVFWSLKNEKYRSTTVFPLFSTGKSTDLQQKHLVVTPLFWHFSENGGAKTILFPIFDAKRNQNGNRNFGILYFLFRYKKDAEQKRADFLYPLCQYKSAPDLRYFRLFPLIWRKKTAEMRYFSIQPFYYQYKKTGFSDYHILWQLFTHKKIEGSMKSWNFLWKTIYLKNYEGEWHEFRLLYLLFADVKKSNYVEKSLFPLYYFSKESNGNRSFSMFLYFYNSFSRQLPNSTEFYREEKIFWFVRLRSNYKRLKAEGKI